MKIRELLNENEESLEQIEPYKTLQKINKENRKLERRINKEKNKRRKIQRENRELKGLLKELINDLKKLAQENNTLTKEYRNL